MARMTGALWKPLASNWASQPRMTRVDLVCIHTMVGSLTGTDSYFRSGNGAGFSGTESHFGTGYNGEIRQWQDTAYQADANLNGNWHIVSIENADYGVGFPQWNTNDGSAVPAFTAAQVEAIAKILAWAYKTHGVPLVLVPDSKVGRRGICYHAQGVDPGRVSGGELWSSAYGKVCPGWRRIAQIPGIIKRARQIAGLEKEEDVVTTAEVQSIASASAKATVAALFAADTSEYYDGTQSFKNVTSQIWTDGRKVKDLLAASAAREAALAAALKSLAATVADQEGFDPLEVSQAVSKAIDEALAGKVVQVEVNVTGGDDEVPA